MLSCLEDTLQRLGLESIDLDQLYCPDGRVPYAESVGTIADMQRERKIKHIGISKLSISQIGVARREADVISVQNAFNLRYGSHSDVLDYCERERLVFIPWMLLGDGSIPWVDPTLMALAGTHGVTPAQISLSALLRHSDAILPIPGTSSRS